MTLEYDVLLYFLPDSVIGPSWLVKHTGSQIQKPLMKHFWPIAELGIVGVAQSEKRKLQVRKDGVRKTLFLYLPPQGLSILRLIPVPSG